MSRRLASVMTLLGCLAGCGAPGGAGGGTKGSEAGGFPPSPPVPGAGAVSAVIRNLTDLSADMTLRFSLYDITVRLTFLRVPGHTSTTVVGPEVTDLLEVSGVAQDGTALPDVSFRHGEDFLDDTQAVYIIGTEELPASVPPTLIFLEPVATTEVVPGEELSVAIIDEDPDSSATISFYLDPFEAPPQEDETASDGVSAVGTNGPDDATDPAAQQDQDAAPTAFSFALDGDEITLATEFAEDPDGQDDQFAFALGEDLPLGSYRVVAVITDELSTSIVQAPGLVQVVAVGSEAGNGEPPAETDQNVAPTLEMLTPADDHTIEAGAFFTVAWTDDDPDDNAVISLFLDPDDDPFNGNEFALADGIEEDPDAGGDRMNLTVGDPPPDTYWVTGLIDDGTISAVATAPGQLTITTP